MDLLYIPEDKTYAMKGYNCCIEEILDYIEYSENSKHCWSKEAFERWRVKTVYIGTEVNYRLHSNCDRHSTSCIKDGSKRPKFENVDESEYHDSQTHKVQ